jgi:uncharacterized protein
MIIITLCAFNLTPMKTNVLWKGREYFSLENCLVATSREGTSVSSAIVGRYNDKIYKIDYHIVTNLDWETTSVDINILCNGRDWRIQFESDGNGEWKSNGKKQERFAGCIDVDIPLTPFTNTLPIRRLGLTPGQSQEISVIYLDLLEHDIYPVQQKYTHVSQTLYHYENIPNDFEADIQVDDHGLVVDYPLLFERVTEVRVSNK